MNSCDFDQESWEYGEICAKQSILFMATSANLEFVLMKMSMLQPNDAQIVEPEPLSDTSCTFISPKIALLLM